MWLNIYRMKQAVQILKGKCPKCKEGEIFKSKGNLLRFKTPVMNAKCPKCDFKFQRETGFFIGSMYVSYGIAVAETIAFFVIAWFGFHIPWTYIYLGVISMIILCSTFNYKLSRIIWIYLFCDK